MASAAERRWTVPRAIMVAGALTLVASIAPLARAAGDAEPASTPPEARELPPPDARPWQTGLLRADRLEHASLSLTLGLGAGLATRKPAVAVIVPATLGFAKEVADRRHGGFDVVDLAADLIGAAAAGALTGLW